MDLHIEPCPPPHHHPHQVMKETGGKLLEEELSDIFMMGAKPLGELDADRVEKMIKKLKMDKDVAVEVLSQVCEDGGGGCSCV